MAMPVYEGNVIQHAGITASVMHATQGIGPITLTELFLLVIRAETYSAVHLILHSKHTEHIKPN